jgi:hypothetical protein
MIYNAIDKIKTYLGTIPIITTITEGDIFEVDLNKQTLFPLAHVIMGNATRQSNVWQLDFNILFIETLDDTKDNKVDAWNKMFQAQARLCELLERTDTTFVLTGSPSAEPFTERFENDLAGWSLSFSILIANDMTVC